MLQRTFMIWFTCLDFEREETNWTCYGHFYLFSELNIVVILKIYSSNLRILLVLYDMIVLKPVPVCPTEYLINDIK